MKRCFIILFSLAFLGLLVFPCFAAGSHESVYRSGSVQLFYDSPYLTFYISDDPDEGFESFSLQYRQSGSSWLSIESWDYSDLQSLELAYRIPDSVIDLANAGIEVQYRFVGHTSGSSVFSNIVTLSVTLPVDFDIVLRLESGNVLVWSSDFPTGSVSYQVYFQSGSDIVTRSTINKFIYIPDDFLAPVGDGSKYVNREQLTVTVRVLFDGSYFYSNPVVISGVPDATFVVDTDLIYVDPRLDEQTYYNPDDYFNLLYSGVTKTPIYKYVFSGLASCLTMCAFIFIIKFVH